MAHAVLGALLAAFLLWPSSVEGGQVNLRICVPYDKMRSDLLRMYQEKPHGYGISGDGELVELYVSPDGETWTIIQIKPRTGLACPRAFGTDWFVLEPNGDV
jgi:hypothetical protein